MTPHEELLAEQLHSLELRVAALEVAARSAASAVPTPVQPEPAPESTFTMPDIFPALGRAVLGMAGAYVLRALAEAGPAPNPFVVAAAVLYSVGWLWQGSRSSGSSSLIYRLTSAAILSPLLWESSVRFHVLPDYAAAGILFAYAVFGAHAISWAAAAATALALMIGTRDLAPFAAALLAIAAFLPRTLTASSVAVALLAFISARAPENYLPISQVFAIGLCALLFTLAALHASHPNTSGIGVAQSALAATVAIAGILTLTQGQAALSIGILSVILAIACYRMGRLRNRPLFTGFGVVFGLLGCLCVFPAILLVPALCAAALLARSFAIHSVLYLVAAGAAATLHPAPISLAAVALTGALCYTLSAKSQICLAPAAMTAVSAGALAFPYLSTAIIVAAIAVSFERIGRRDGRPEMQWMAYAALALGSLKLLLIDFHQSTPAALALSLLCYGGMLLLLPRLRFSQSPPTPEKCDPELHERGVRSSGP